jgi:hypothetical protein
MGREGFLSILRCLHFAPNPPAGVNPENRLCKISPLIDYFNKKMLDIYYPQRNLCIDESMVLWRGRLSFRQYIPNKRHKYGVKFYMLTEPSGTIIKFLIYTGALGDFGGVGHAANVVLHLLHEKLDVGHAIYMDNFSNSYNLAKQLLDRKTYSTGTLRVNRKKYTNASYNGKTNSWGNCGQLCQRCTGGKMERQKRRDFYQYRI